MRGGLRAVMALAVAGACYAPHAVEGVACDRSAPACPSGQVCVQTADGDRCERGPGADPGDAAGDVDADIDVPDAPPVLDPNGDEDGDGRPNGTDNCVFAANADQHDEDGDHIGDACDPCPIFAVGGTADADGDGVGDACDPNPSTAGDRIYLFESFKAGIPTTAGWDSYGSWGGQDTMNINTGDSEHASISFTMPLTGNETITTQVSVMSLGHAATNRGAGTIDEKGNAGSDGVACDLFANTGNERRFGLVHATTAAAGADDLASQAVAWNLGQRYVIVEHRRDAMYTCTGNGTNVSSASAITNPDPQVGVWASNAAARFDYLFVVTSP